MRKRFSILSLLVLVLVLVLSGCAPKVDAPVKDIVNDIQPIVIEEEIDEDMIGVIEGSAEEEVATEGASADSDMKGMDYNTNWNYFEDREAGISLQYPQIVSMDDSDSLFKLRVEIENIDNLEGTMGFDAETAKKNLQFLSNAQYGEDVDFPLEASKNIRSIKGINAQDFVVLSRFEICSTIFERKLYLFNNDNQIVITVSASGRDIITDAPEYFEMNEANCGDDKIWNFDKQEQFYVDLVQGKELGLALEWFNTFDKIINTIFLIEKTGDESLSVGIANPASIFCEENGGVSEIVETEDGEGGICNFEDGTYCEEWAFFRNECEPRGGSHGQTSVFNNIYFHV